MSVEERRQKLRREAERELAYLNLSRHQHDLPPIASEAELQAYYIGFIAGARALHERRL